jgi:hypothetical protein
MAEMWRKCNACKNPIAYNANHWVCSVSTCNRARTGLVFCTVSCWDSHVADARHRDAWAVDARAPSKEAWEKELADSAPEPAAPPRPAPAPVVRRVVGEPAPTAAAAGTPTGAVQLSEAERDPLIVVSKMKKYIKERSGMNCSDAVADMLSEHVRVICDDAIRAAARDERKTVLDRDVPRAPVRR